MASLNIFSNPENPFPTIWKCPVSRKVFFCICFWNRFPRQQKKLHLYFLVSLIICLTHPFCLFLSIFDCLFVTLSLLFVSFHKSLSFFYCLLLFHCFHQLPFVTLSLLPSLTAYCLLLPLCLFVFHLSFFLSIYLFIYFSLFLSFFQT